MKIFKIGISGVVLLLVSLACVVTIPVPGRANSSVSVTPLETPSPINSPTSPSLPDKTIAPSKTPVPPPTQRAVVTEAVFAFPTITPLPPIPSMTLPNFEETPIGGSATPVGTIQIVKIYTPTRERLKCKVELVKPQIGQDFKPGVEFEAAWRVTNQGSKIWAKEDFYFDFISGHKMHNPGHGPYYVTYTVYPDDRFRLNVRMLAPKKPGRYSATWGLWQADRKEPFCTFEVVIDVK